MSTCWTLKVGSPLRQPTPLAEANCSCVEKTAMKNAPNFTNSELFRWRIAPYHVTLVGLVGLDQNERKAAVQRFANALDAELGEHVMRWNAAYWNARRHCAKDRTARQKNDVAVWEAALARATAVATDFLLADEVVYFEVR